MKRFVIATVIAFLVTSMAFGLEVILSTGQIKLPNYDGTFSNISISDRAGIFLCLTDVAAYQTYAEDSAGLYQAWQDGDFDSETYTYSNTIQESGRSEVHFDCDADGGTFYAIAVATFYSESYNRAYYVARIVSQEYLGNDPEMVPLKITQMISGANSWTVVPEPKLLTLFMLGLTVVVYKRKIS